MIDRYLYILTRQEDDRAHDVIGKIMTPAAPRKPIRRFGGLIHMVIDGMGSASTRIIFRFGT